MRNLFDCSKGDLLQMKSCPSGENLQSIRTTNRSLVFDAINTVGVVSRSELAEITGLSASTITNITSEFLKVGLIEEIGHQKSSGGRRRTLLRVNRGFGYIIGLQISRTEVHCAVVALDGSIVKLGVRKSSLTESTDVSIPNIIALIRETVCTSDVEWDKIRGIGVGAPGPLDASTGVIVCPPNFPRWENVPITSILEAEFGVQTYLGNEVNLCALAERRYGLAQGVDDFIYITIEAGIGAGIFTGGRLCRGVGKLVGGFGHTSIAFDGPRCSCGNYGCLEVYATEPAILSRTRQRLLSGEESRINDMLNGNMGMLTTATIRDAAKQGDRLALDIIDSTCRMLGIGIVNLINLYNPDLVILGYGLPQVWGNEMLERVSKTIELCAMKPSLKNFRLKLSRLGETAVVRGAATMVLNELTMNVEGLLNAANRRAR